MEKLTYSKTLDRLKHAKENVVSVVGIPGTGKIALLTQLAKESEKNAFVFDPFNGYDEQELNTRLNDENAYVILDEFDSQDEGIDITLDLIYQAKAKVFLTGRTFVFTDKKIMDKDHLMIELIPDMNLFQSWLEKLTAETHEKYINRTASYFKD